MKYRNFVLIGRSGCGKGTQAKMLMETVGNLVRISTGDLFRKLEKTGSATAKKISDILKGGGLPFDDIATTLWMHEIAHNVKEEQGFILDGAPRRLNEAHNFDRFMEFLEQKEETAVILLDVSREEATRRLLERAKSEKRYDDTPGAIKNRMDYYENRSSEVADFYEREGRLISINGEQSVEKIRADILEHIGYSGFV